MHEKISIKYKYEMSFCALTQLKWKTDGSETVCPLCEWKKIFKRNVYLTHLLRRQNIIISCIIFSSSRLAVPRSKHCTPMTTHPWYRHVPKWVLTDFVCFVFDGISIWFVASQMLGHVTSYTGKRLPVKSLFFKIGLYLCYFSKECLQQ